MTLDCIVKQLLVAAFLGAVTSIATGLPQPWRALAWLAFIACVAWALWCLWRIEHTR